jgi:tetratricopeptide (TPR) repeat protein
VQTIKKILALVSISCFFIYGTGQLYLFHINQCAISYFKAGKFQEALSMLQPIVAKYTWNSDLMISYATSLEALSHFQESADILESAKLITFDYRLNLQLAILYEKMEKWDDSSREYRAVLDYSEKQADALKGFMTQTTNRIMRLGPDPSQTDLNSIEGTIDYLARLAPNTANLLENKIIILYLKNDSNALQKISQQSPNLKILQPCLLLSKMKSDIDSQQWNEALAIADQLAFSWRNYPVIMIRLFYELDRSKPENVEILVPFYCIRGQILASGGNFSKAILEFRRASEIDPSNERIKNAINDIEKQLNATK